MLQNKKLKIGITAGDPAGIGPEVSLKAVNDISNENIIPIVISRKSVMTELYPEIFKDYILLNSETVKGNLEPFKKYLYDADFNFPLPKYGKGSKITGAESLAYIDCALDLWKDNSIHALVTGPVNKWHINQTGIKFTGHTEYIASHTGNKKPYMMMFSKDLRVILATTHIPIANVTESVTKEVLLELILMANETALSIDGEKVKLAIAGLDPHCGDKGAIGDFDENITSAAVSEARALGVDIDGPFAADTLFIREKWKQYNIAIAQYHDQGLIPFKVLAFDTGVNITLGLDIVRTSVDHGTAYDIAGLGKAGHISMTEAIECAYRLVI